MLQAVGSATYGGLEGAGFPRRTGATPEEAPQLEEHSGSWRSS